MSPTDTHNALASATYLSVLIQSSISLSAKFGLEKPNDRRALDLMNAAARAVLQEIPDIPLAYGMSDEFRSRTMEVCSEYGKADIRG